METLNAKVVHNMPFHAVATALQAAGLNGADETFWNAVRGNIGRVRDADYWWRVCTGTVEPLVATEDAGFIAAAAASVPEGPWDTGTWSAWTGALKQETGRKGKQLFMPLRKALTGRERGPELADLLPLIGRDRVLERLAA